MLDELLEAAVERLAANELEFKLTVDGVQAGLLYVLDFTVDEGLNRPFVLDLTVLCSDDQIPLARFIGQSAVLTSASPSGERHWHGLVCEAQTAGRTRHFGRFRLRVVPRLWLLSRRRDSRIFQGLSTPEIVQQVLGAAGVTGSGLELRLRRDYPPRDYCVQYRETDLDFVSRLMEEEGICYAFRHSQTGHTLVLSDDAVTHEPLSPPTVRFMPATLSGGVGQNIEQLALVRRIQPGRATLRDFAFKGPSEDLEVSVEYDGAGAEVDGQEGDPNTDLEFYDYPGEYVDRQLGEALARLRLEQLQAQRFGVEGRSTARRLCPGFRMQVSGHDRPGLNREWLLTRVQHAGTQPNPDKPDEVGVPPTYTNQLHAIPAELTWRPPLETARPSIPGLQTAMVTGPAGEEIHTDEFGRVKVQFHWDRLGRRDDLSSCWVRVSHPSAGAGFGQVILPRVGQEVIVQFLEGDPDRPVVTGRLYNGEQTPPAPLPDKRALSSIKSSSYPGGAGYNELTFDDTAGSEKIVMHGQKDAAITIGNDQSTSVGNDETHSVAANRTASVGGDEACSVTGNRTASVNGNEDTTVQGNRSVAVQGNETRSVTGNQTQSVTGNQTESVTGNRTASVTGNQDESITGNSSQTVSGGQASVNVTGTWAVTASSAANINAGSTGDFSAGTSLSVSSPSVTVTGDDTVLVKSDSKVTIQVGGSSITLGTNTITLKADTITLEGKDVTLNGSTSVNLKGKAVNSNAAAVNTLTGTTIKLN